MAKVKKIKEGDERYFPQRLYYLGNDETGLTRVSEESWRKAGGFSAIGMMRSRGMDEYFDSSLDPIPNETEV